ncbi:MAG: sugar ABC transporter substrate-binding protein [Anaerolinea sp.]|mgnify:CR=1 FL=1|nr:sugar ABC transporter substrate-binding protein [Anaerolinea sp.]
MSLKKTGLSRRDFLKLSAAGGAGLAALSTGLPRLLAQDQIAYLRFLTQEVDAPQVEAHRQNIRAFEAAHPDIRVELQLTGAEQIVERMVAALTSGVTSLDVLQPNPATALGVAARGQLLPIDDLVESLGGDDFFYGNSVMKLNGTSYGIPFGGGVVMFWYRQDLFEEAGIGVPTTWEELEAAARHFTRTLNPDSPTEYGISLPFSKHASTNFSVSPFWWSAGGDYFDKDLNITFESDATVEFLEWYASMYQYTSPSATGWAWGDLINTFLSGQTAMTLYLGRVLSRVYMNAPDLVGKVGVFPYPRRILRATEDDPNYLVINANTPYPDAAKEWVRYLVTGDAANQFLCTVPGHLPPATSEQQAWWDQDVTGCTILDENPEIKRLIGEAVDYAFFPVLNAGGVQEAVAQGADAPIPTGVPNPMYMVPSISTLTLPAAIQEMILNGRTARDAMMTVLPELEAGVNTMKTEIGWES